MSATYIYKPGTYKGPVILVPSEGPKGSVTITTPDGQTFEGKYLNTNEGRHQYVFPKEIYNYQDLKVSYNGQEGTIASGTTSYEGNSFGDWQARAKGSIGPGGGTEGVPGQFTPGSIGYGSVPTYLGNEYPSPVFSQFQSTKAPNIKTAPYNFIDPGAFATSFGAVNRAQYVQNASLSKDIALDQLDTELQGLQGYAPAAAAIKRGETAQDNAFNQGQRDTQIAQELPNARGDLEAQRRRANIYAEGRIPDEITDRSLELGVRSAAADNATAGGFGTGSVAASNLSNTMSAKERLAIAAQGENLVSANLKDSSQLLLAPLEYSTAGSQINVMPSLSGSQLASKALTDLNALTTIDPANALNTAVNQNQFGSNLEQRTREYNANARQNTDQFNSTGLYNASANNASIANNFSLGKFAYDVTYAGAAAGAAQLNTNTNLAISQQKQYEEIFKNMLSKAQNAQEKGSIANAIAAAIPIIASLFSGKGAATTTPGPGITQTGTPGGTGGGSSDGSVPGQVTGPNLTSTDAGGNVQLPPGTHTDADGSIILPSGSPMPEGFHGGQIVDDGQVIEPDSSSGSGPTLAPEPDGFHYETNDDGDGFVLIPDEPPSSDPVVSGMEDDGIDIGAIDSRSLRTLKTKAAAVNSTMGISAKPIEGSVLAGYNTQGKPQYMNTTAMRSQDSSAGAKTTNTLQEILSPLGVFKDQKDATTLQQIGSTAGDVAFAAKLTDLYQRGDRAGFASAIAGKFGASTLSALGVGEKTVQGASTLFAAYNLYNNWGQLSPAQKSMGLATVGIQGYKSVTGTDLASTPIIEAGAGNPGLNVGQALGLFSAGYNVYNLAKNWNQLNTVQKIAAGSGDAAQIADLAQSFNLLGNSASGAGGSGAFAGSTAGASTASPALSGLSSVAGGVGIAAGAYQIYNAWGKGGKQNTIAGAAGGAAVAAGLYAMAGTNPYVLAGVVAASALGANVESKESQRGAAAVLYTNPVTAPFAIAADAILKGSISAPFKSGKSEEQVGRDAMRGHLQTIGIADKKFAITLADGTKADIGADGKSGSFTVRDPSKWVGGKAPSSLHSYDTDYTNDLDYTSAMGGIALARLTAGGKGKPIDQLGGQLGNAMLENIGHGKDFSTANYNKLMENQRAVYAQAGIKSKAEGYALAEQAFKEGRIDATDLVATQQSLNMMYDRDGYNTAQKLMAGRFRGIEVAAKDPAPKSDLDNPTRDVKTVPLSIPSSSSSSSTSTPVPRGGNPRLLPTKAQMAAQNKLKFGSSSPLNQMGAS